MAGGGNTARFVRDITDAEVEDARRYGGKASGLARMSRAGIPIPPAFVIGTAGFHHVRAHNGQIDAALMMEVRQAIGRLESASGKSFGGIERPLLVSVRSGAAISMPGMMDTILNLGLTAQSAFSLARMTGKPDFALDTWMRFWRMFSDIVLDVDSAELTEAVADLRKNARLTDTPEAYSALEDAVLDHLSAYGATPRREPWEQLELTIGAIFRSWDSARAKAYRQHHRIADDLGTAVTVQAMVFGNADQNSGSGVAFTRNPNNGGKALYGEYLIGRQGEDLVSGAHTPIDLADPMAMDKTLRAALIAHGDTLEALYRDAVDIEFTVEAGRLYLLQVRPAKRTAAAAVKIAEDLVAEGLLTRQAALQKISVEQLKKLARPAFEPTDLAAAKEIAQGLASSPGHAHGAAVLDSDRAAERAGAGEAVILLRPTTSPQDIRGMLAATGIVTATGGALSHAAVVSRALDKPCIVGCATIAIDFEQRSFMIGAQRFREGDSLSIDGETGKVYAGALRLQPAGSSAAPLRHILDWADDAAAAQVWPTPHGNEELSLALQFTPPGVGVVDLTDLIVMHGDIDRFIELIGAVSQGKPAAATYDGISAIVRAACQPIMAAAHGIPLHIRLPRVSSYQARRLIENWTELAPDLFLPLGALPYLQSILAGLATAAQAAHHSQVTALIGGITDPLEFANFQHQTVQAGSLAAGAVIQNIAALHAAPHLARLGAALWIDITEIIRTAYGFPAEVQQATSALDAYIAQWRLARHPFKQLDPLLGSLLATTLAAAESRHVIGIDCALDCTTELIVELYRLGFRRFSVAAIRRNEVRLLLGQLREE